MSELKESAKIADGVTEGLAMLDRLPSFSDPADEWREAESRAVK